MGWRAGNPQPRTGLLLALVFLGLVFAIAALIPRTTARVVATSPSLDGKTGAALMALSVDGAVTHGFRVCLWRPVWLPINATGCREVAYLGDVESDGETPPIDLVWTAASQLEIRYTNAAVVDVYVPVFSWIANRPQRPYGYYRLQTPIYTRAVPVGRAAPHALDDKH